jgi:hypothetical protein
MLKATKLCQVQVISVFSTIVGTEVEKNLGVLDFVFDYLFFDSLVMQCFLK